MSSISVPSQESELVNFMVKQEGERRSSVRRCLCVAAARLNSALCFPAKREDWKAAKLTVSDIFSPVLLVMMSQLNLLFFLIVGTQACL